MRYFILLLLLATSQMYSIEAINYCNEFAQVYSMYDTEEYGLLISNSTGVYMVNKSDGSMQPVLYKNEKLISEIDHFFEYDNDLYCYRKQSILYRIKDGNADSIAISVVAHYVKDNNLYLLRSKEPRVQVIEDGSSTLYSTADYEGTHLYADLIEINDEVYAYLGMNWSGYRLIFKITNNGPEYLMSKSHKDHDEFRDLFPNAIYCVNNELWVQTSKGFYKHEGDGFVPVSTEYTFNLQHTYLCHYENGILYGINNNGIFMYSFDIKETVYLKEQSIEYYNKKNLYKGQNVLYFQIDEGIYLYDPETKEFSEFQQNETSNILCFIESIAKNLIIARESYIEWYNTYPPVILSKESVHANEFYDIAYDSHHDMIVALGVSDENYFIQRFNGFKWDIIPVPMSNKAIGNSIMPYIKVQPDMNGKYYVSIYDFLGIWDGNEWERISFLKDPDHLENRPKEEYYILCLDSLGGVWVSVYLKEFSYEINDYESTNSIYRITDKGIELIDENLKSNYTGLFRDGIYLNSGDVVIDSWSDEIYYYSSDEGQGELLIPEDGDDHPLTNGNRELCQNKNGDLVICYSMSSGWHMNYGTFTLPGGISVYDGKTWDHDQYDDILEESEMEILFLNLFIDKDGNECLINHEKLLVILNDEEFLSYPITGLSLSFSNMLHIKNEIWFNHIKQGLFKINLPSYNSVAEDLRSQNILKNEIITDDFLELSDNYDSYQIFSLSGQTVSSGNSNYRINVSGLSNGVYFIVCQSNSKYLSEKFIISR